MDRKDQPSYKRFLLFWWDMPNSTECDGGLSDVWESYDDIADALKFVVEKNSYDYEIFDCDLRRVVASEHPEYGVAKAA